MVSGCKIIKYVNKKLCLVLLCVGGSPLKKEFPFSPILIPQSILNLVLKHSPEEIKPKSKINLTVSAIFILESLVEYVRKLEIKSLSLFVTHISYKNHLASFSAGLSKKRVSVNRYCAIIHM